MLGELLDQMPRLTLLVTCDRPPGHVGWHSAQQVTVPPLSAVLSLRLLLLHTPRTLSAGEIARVVRERRLRLAGQQGQCVGDM